MQLRDSHTGTVIQRGRQCRSFDERWLEFIVRSTVPTKYWRLIDDGRIQCDLCPRQCKLHEGQRGFCFVRAGQDGQIVLTTYGRSNGFCVDPIEKKPLNHFLPGNAGPVVWDGRLQPGLPVLPELGHLEIPQVRHAG